MKIKLLFIVLLASLNCFAQPANDNCANATALTIDAPLLCSQTTASATAQGGEYCAASGGGVTPRTVWYSFVATSTTMVLNVIRTNTTNCFARVSVYGPNAACLPGAGTAIFDCVILNGDPGVFQALTGLTVGATYRIQYNGQDCGGGSDRAHQFCIGIYNPAPNNAVATGSVIDACGTVFNGTTQGGYFPSGSGVGFRDLDNNLGTTCPACGAQPGADVPFVVNNDSWFSFCAATAGTWQVTFTVGACALSGLNSGLQMAIFTGTPGALTWLAQAPNPTYTGDTWVSPNITLAAGECAYLMVDGFAGDACGYSYVLTPIGGSPCDLVTTCGITANPTCTTPGLYTLSGEVTFSNPPATGTMTVTNNCGGSQVFNAPFTSPIAYSLPGLTANGANCTVSASFSDTSDCAASANYVAPLSPAVPTINTTAPTCSADGFATITNYVGGLTYVFTPAGPIVDGTGLISNMTIGTNYVVSASNGSCASADSASFVIAAMLPTPAVPTITTTAPTCSADGFSEISNYVGGTIYVFTPAGPTVDGTGMISGMTVGTSYTVTAGNGTCTSAASASFTNLAQLAVPVVPIVDLTAPTCSADGFATITNYVGGLTYVFTPAGPIVDGTGLISNMAIGTNYVVSASNGSCASADSASFVIAAMLPTPAVPTITTTAPTCSADGFSQISNYVGGTIYVFTPAGPTVDGTGMISGMTVGTSYTVTAGNGTCTSAASTSFTNLAQLAVPVVPTVDVTAPTCSADGFATITNYVGGLTYVFTPAGPIVDGTGLISNMTIGTNYVVSASNGSCASADSASFVIAAMLPTPAVPTITTTAPTCSADGFSEISNYVGGTIYVFTPAGPTVDGTGMISGMTVGTSYTVTAGNGTCTSAASTSFTNLAQLTVPAVPTINTTAPTCSADGFATITNYVGGLTYVFTPAGPIVDGTGLISNMTIGTNYVVSASNGSCASADSASFVIAAMLPTPAVPTITTTAPTCSADGFSEISNYVGGTIYVFTPAGPTVDGTGMISGMTVGTSYTVTAGNGTCTSAASTSFTNLAQLTVPAVPTINTTAPTCSADGFATITNYVGGLTYVFTPAGPIVDGTGLISNMTIGTNYVVSASNGSCASADSASFVIAAMLPTPAVPTITTTAPTCSADGFSQISNYVGGTIYVFTPAGPTVDGTGMISGMTVGTSYTVTAGNGTCTSAASASFTNLAQLAVPVVPIVDLTAPTCSADGFATITNYVGGLTYVFTPAGPIVDGTGLISNMAIGTNYVVSASNGSCASADSASFVIAAMLPTPAVPTITTTAPTCSADGFSQISNYVGGTIYVFTPAGPTVDGTGMISGMTVGTSYTVTAGNGTCTSAASTSFTNLAQLAVPVVPTVDVTAPTCSADGFATITNYVGGLTYVFTPAGPIVDGTGLISNMTIGTNYVVSASNGSCASADSASFVIAAMLPTPAVPTITTTAPTCSADGFSEISNYVGGTIYVFTPAGPTVDGTGMISGMTVGTSYTVTAGNGTCTSAASTSFTNLAQLTVPAVPTINTTAPTCSADGFATITNYVGGLTYVFTPAGPIVDGTGLISNMTIGTNYVVSASNGSCASADSASFVIAAMLPTPAVPTVTVTQPSCATPTATILVVSPIGANLEYSIDNGVSYQTSTSFSGLVPSSFYTIIVRDVVSGCVSNASSNIITDAVPSSPIVALSSGCNGSSYEIVASTTSSSATYEWYNGSTLIGSAAAVVVSSVGTYQVDVTVDGCTTTEFITIDNVTCSIPKGISPNGDGLNDTWDISGLNARKVQIFNRYGVEVYSRSNYTSEFEGKTNNGNELPTGTYYYVITLDTEAKTGWLYINRAQ
jgi:gliding motility-associated-like protein